MTNIDLDKYTRNFRMFYSKIIGGHPQQGALENKFKFILENQLSKFRFNMYGKSEDSLSVKSMLSQARSMKSKTNQSKQKFDWIFQTIDFSRTFIFGCIVSLLEAKSKEGMTIIRQGLQQQNAFIEGSIFKGAIYRKIVFSWSKIQKLFQSSFVVKPYITISESLNDLCDQFINMLFNVLTEGKITRFQNSNISEQKLKKLCQITRLNINYFEIQGGQIKNVKKCGENKKTINVGYIIDDGIFVVSKELPKKKREDVQQQKLLKKLHQVSDDLFKMYSQTQVKLNSLDSLTSKNVKLSKTSAINVITNDKPKLKRALSVKSEKGY